MSTRRPKPAPRRHVYIARSFGKGCSPRKTATARVNGTRGGRPPLYRYYVARLDADATTGLQWVVVDRQGKDAHRPVRSYHAGRALAASLNPTQQENQ